MIPVNLRVRNFLPYKGESTQLGFNAIHTACISGDNGAGKSSIIDAITWAIWGKSRAKSDDDLIHQSETETEVEFDFSAGGQHYRVIRRHTRPSGKRASGQSSLNLYIYSSGEFLPMTAERMRQTEEKIKSILHMDYDTFINSAYLRQGHADEFTRQDPSKRKEVLATILGLEIYDCYEERAKEQGKIAQENKRQISGSISEIEAKLINKPAYEAELLQREKHFKATVSAINALGSAMEQLRQEDQQLASVQTQLDQLITAIHRSSEDLKRKNKQYLESLKRIDEYKSLLEQRPKIEAAYQQFQKTLEHCEEMDRQARQIIDLRDKCKPFEKVCDNEKNDLNIQRKIIENALKELGKRAAQVASLDAEKQKLDQKRQALTQTKKELESSKELLRKYKVDLSRLYDENKRANQYIADIVEKQRLLVENKSKAICPLCESYISDGQLALVQNKYSSDKKNMLHIIDENDKAINKLSDSIEDGEAKIRQKENTYNDESSIFINREAHLTQSLKESFEAENKITGAKIELEAINNRLATGDYAHTEQEALACIEAQIATFSYDATRHEKLQQEKLQLQNSEHQKQRLNEAAIQLQREQESAASYIEDILDIQKRLEQDNHTLLQLTHVLEKRPELQRKLSIAISSFEQQTKEQQTARDDVTSIKEKLAQLADMENDLAEKRKRFATESENESLYKQAAQIFGKKGIQAMLIETALPEIEAEANHLLGRMTDGRMTIVFETQQTTKKGESSETLDIKIADELGTRNYELFSGGEGFRIDFAVRIALSRLLARRAGAPLPTLIIDEGFGTQDTDGIEKLKEAINAIQDDFQKILIITHIEELKDAFPVRINVVKTAEGSTIYVT